jgi:WD40 repeat protein
MLSFGNENILNLMIKNLKLPECKHLFNTVFNIKLSKTIIKQISYKNIFKSIGRIQYKLDEKKGLIDNIVILHNGDIVLLSSSIMTIKVWELTQCNFKRIIENETTASAAVILENGNLIIRYMGLKFWDTNDDFNCIKHIKLNDYINNILLLQDGKLVCISRQDVLVFDCNNDYKHVMRFKAHNNIMNALVKISNNNFATGSDDNIINIWDANVYTCLKGLKEHKGCVISLIFIDRYNLLISGSFDKTICIWDLNNYHCIQTLYVENGVLRLLSLPNGYFAYLSLNNTIELLDIIKFRCINAISTNFRVNCLQLMEDNRIIAAFYPNVIIWGY